MPAHHALAKKLDESSDAFDAVQKVGEWVRHSGTGKGLEDWPIEQIRSSLAKFKAEIAKTGHDPEREPIGIAVELPLINYMLDELQKFIKGTPCDIFNQRVAQVFVECLMAKLCAIHHMAEELDAEYQEV